MLSLMVCVGDMDVLLQLNHVQRHLLCGHVQNLCKNPRGVSLISCMVSQLNSYHVWEANQTLIIYRKSNEPHIMYSKPNE